MQYSIFAADLTDRELTAMKHGLFKLIDEQEDNVRFWAAPVDLRMFGARRLPEGVYAFANGAAGLTNALHNTRRTRRQKTAPGQAFARRYSVRRMP